MLSSLGVKSYNTSDFQCSGVKRFAFTVRCVNNISVNTAELSE